MDQKILNQVQIDTISAIVKQIIDSKVEALLIEESYILKLQRAKKEIDTNSLEFFHPFYYLDWTDMFRLFKSKVNIELIEQQISKTKREVIVNCLESLRLLRNDIAHSRLIKVEDIEFIKFSYHQISISIPCFDTLYVYQTQEKKSTNLPEEVKIFLKKFDQPQMASIETITEALVYFKNCINSFWLNTYNFKLVELLILLHGELENYKVHRSSIGGLLKIQNWRAKNKLLISQIKDILK